MRTKTQKLGRRNTYTPTDASQVCSSVVMPLNREETLSVDSLKTHPNSLDGNLRSGQSGQDLRVPVLNMRREPLMPTTPRKARLLVKQKKAKVIQRTPFVIQLQYQTGEAKQEMTLGIDSGYAYVGFSAKTEKAELISGEMVLRKYMSKRLEEKRMYRRSRRNKLRYRKPRFLNRKRKGGWLAPSIQHKLDTHIRLIEKLKHWLPITNTVIEVASFDTQKMQNPEISGIEYQQGELQGYEVRAYLLEKWGRNCVYCNKKKIPLEVEHIIPKSRGGSNRVSNLTISCRKCNLKKGNKTAEEFGFPNIQKQAKETLKATAFMNVVRKLLTKQINAEETFGYITKYRRIINNLDKSHSNDAFVIARGTNQIRCKAYFVTQTRRNNRKLQTNRKGYRLSIRKKKYSLQPNDLVKYKDRLYRIKGVHCRGTRFIINSNSKNKSCNIKDMELIHYGKGLQFKLAGVTSRNSPSP